FSSQWPSCWCGGHITSVCKEMPGVVGKVTDMMAKAQDGLSLSDALANSSTLATRHNLAYWMGEAGDVDGARDLFAEVLAVREREIGTAHPCTPVTRHNLAVLLGGAGDAAGARELFAVVLPVGERVLGTAH